MNETELTAWMNALPEDRAELEALQAELTARRHVAADHYYAAVGQGQEAAREARRELDGIEAQLRILENEMAR